MIRRSSTFSGHVQGVGFRYAVQDLATRFAVRGYVRNLPNGNVELTAEGDAAELDRFLGAIGEKMEGFIKKRSDNDAAATNEFHNFSIRH